MLPVVLICYAALVMGVLLFLLWREGPAEHF